MSGHERLLVAVFPAPRDYLHSPYDFIISYSDKGVEIKIASSYFPLVQCSRTIIQDSSPLRGSRRFCGGCGPDSLRLSGPQPPQNEAPPVATQKICVGVS